ncbi:MAG: peptidoglycan-associated lipoprotein Pal [Gemmatimonadaceae bacterium]|nr:peptidoglycan-associated lipoprotein Pal [Gemmatimonadaceae bacterium]
MHARIRSLAFVALAMSAVASTACKKKPVVVPPPAPAPAPKFNQDSADAADRAKREAAERAAREAAERAAREAAAKLAAEVAAAKAAFATPVYFDYDKSEIREDQRMTLEAKIPVFQANADMRIRVAGHTDNRGSDEYNLALGQRRAAAVKEYLIARGISGDRIDVVSFGEERPAVAQDNEDAWAKNRRDEFEIIAGANPFKLPNK